MAKSEIGNSGGAGFGESGENMLILRTQHTIHLDVSQLFRQKKQGSGETPKLQMKISDLFL